MSKLWDFIKNWNYIALEDVESPETRVSDSQVKLEKLIDNGGDVNEQLQDGTTLLLLALDKFSKDAKIHKEKKIYTDFFWIVKCLIKKGAKVNSRTKENDTPLILIVKNAPEHIKTFLRLTERKEIDIDFCNDDGLTALSIAISKIDESCGYKLSRRYRNSASYVYGHVEIKYGYDAAIGLIAAGAACDTLDKDGHTPLILAIKKGEKAKKVITALLAKDEVKRSINHRDNSGNSALYYAVVNGHLDVVKALIKAGASINNVVTNQGETPLAVAGKKGRLVSQNI